MRSCYQKRSVCRVPGWPRGPILPPPITIRPRPPLINLIKLEGRPDNSLGKLSLNVTNPSSSLLVSVESNNQVMNSVAPDPRKSGTLSEQMERLVWPSVKATGSFIISYLWKFKLKLSKTEGLEQNNVWQRTSLDCVRTTLAVESCFQAWCNLTECCVV